MRGTFSIAAMALGMPGFLMQSLGLIEGRFWLSIAGTVLLVVGLAFYFKAKGRHPFWALWGVVPIMGVIVCLAAQERAETTARQTVENILIEEDPHVRTLREFKTSPVMGGRPFLVLMAPVGLLVLLFGPQLPYLVMQQETRIEEAAQPPAPDEQRASAQDARPSSGPAPQPEKEPPEPAQAGPDKTTIADKPSPPLPDSTSGEGGDAASKEAETSVTRFMRIQKGMSYEDVRAIVGSDGKVVSAPSKGNEIFQWKNPDGSYFAAAFKDSALHRTTGLHFPPALTEATTEEEPEGTEASSQEAQPSAPEQSEDIPEAGPQQDFDTDVYVAQGPPDGAEEYLDDAAPLDQQSFDALPEEAVRQRPRVVVAARERDEPAGGRQAYKRPRLPRYVSGLKHGPHDVHIYNNNDFPAKVGLRSGKRGKDFTLPPGGATTLYLPNGSYKVYYVRTDEEASALESGGAFSINSPTEGIYLRLRY